MDWVVWPVLKVSCDTKKLDALIKRIAKINGKEIEIGFFPEDRYGPENGNLSVAQVAYYNEFGTSLNPTRPFMAETFESPTNQFHIANEFKKLALDLLKNGRGTNRLLKQVGEMVKDMMQVSIDDYPGSNSQKTIERKGGRNDPLFDTGKMLKSVKFKFKEA